MIIAQFGLNNTVVLLTRIMERWKVFLNKKQVVFSKLFSLVTDGNPIHIDKIPVLASLIPSWLSWTKFNFAANLLISEDANFFFSGLCWFSLETNYLYLFNSWTRQNPEKKKLTDWPERKFSAAKTCGHLLPMFLLS